MIIQNERGLDRFAASLDALYKASFDGLCLNESNPAEIRSLLSNGADVVSTAAIKQCVFSFISAPPEVATWVLGYVCTSGAMRGRGHASQCIGELFDALEKSEWIMVLNCRPGLVPFYEKNGFATIAPRASYDRNGVVTIDDDPVMARCSAPELWSMITKNEVLHLGEEF
jgi:GNAT superfamily N-acetyltransferase